MKKEPSGILPPEQSDLIPENEEQARKRLTALMNTIPLTAADWETFLRGWWALFWLHPGLHPDDWEGWESEFESYRPLAAEAFRRAAGGELTDDELYPAEAAQLEAPTCDFGSPHVEHHRVSLPVNRVPDRHN